MKNQHSNNKAILLTLLLLTLVACKNEKSDSLNHTSNKQPVQTTSNLELSNSIIDTSASSNTERDTYSSKSQYNCCQT